MKITKESEISNIILDYCEGKRHCEFCIDDLPKMVDDIKELLIREIRDYAEHVDDACNCIRGL
jgi:hypothetical protein